MCQVIAPAPLRWVPVNELFKPPKAEEKVSPTVGVAYTAIQDYYFTHTRTAAKKNGDRATKLQCLHDGVWTDAPDILPGERLLVKRDTMFRAVPLEQP